jgi:hypothetical protein
MDLKPFEFWDNLLDERQSKEVLFAAEYTHNFGHGTDGHIRLLLISRLVDILNTYYEQLEEYAELIQEKDMLLDDASLEIKYLTNDLEDKGYEIEDLKSKNNGL